MLRIERILCPVDFSEFSVPAYEYAQSLALHYEAKLILGHIVPPVFATYPSYVYPDMVNDIYQDLRSHAEEQLTLFASSHRREGVQVVNKVCEGGATESILALATAESVDLIVMGTHGRHGFDHLLLGSVTEKVLRKARCPVLAVRAPAHGFVAAEGVGFVHFRKILFGTDFSPHSERALEYALSLAEEYTAELTLLNVLEEVPPSTDLSAITADIIRQLEAPIPAEVREWCTIKPRLRVGRPYQEIIHHAREVGADLVILGVRGRNALDLALFGSTTHRVMQSGPCPVLAVHI